jgi:hypothetical protein
MAAQPGNRRLGREGKGRASGGLQLFNGEYRKTRLWTAIGLAAAWVGFQSTSIEVLKCLANGVSLSMLAPLHSKSQKQIDRSTAFDVPNE